MKIKIAMGVLFALVLGCSLARADFKYSQTSKMTGGMMAGAMKMMSVFNKQLREPILSTTYVKGHQMRRESADGTVEIIDLDARHIININTKKQTYTVVTFDQMRQMLQKMQQQMQQTPKAKNGQPSPQIQMKFNVVPTNQTRQILGQTAKEMKIEADTVIEGQDPNHPESGAQSAAMKMAIDSWLAPNVSGYQEVMEFNKQMAKLINWTPNAAPTMDPRMTQAMVEMAKSGKLPSGFPLLETINFGMAGMSQAQPQTNANTKSQSSASSTPADSPQAVAAKAIGGMFGGFGRFGHKKKQQDSSPASDNNTPAQPSNPAAPGSLMEMTIQVTSFSAGSLDSSLFQVPAGYTQVESNPNNPFGGPR
jgi:hypothetical protein